SVYGQEKENRSFYLKGAKFTFPLIEKWVSEYNKLNPQLQIKINTKQIPDAQGLNVVAYQLTDSDQLANQTAFYVGRYALVPVSNKQNPILSKAGKGGLSKKVLKKLFFDESDEYSEDQQDAKSKYIATVYARESQAPTTIALARYFGVKPVNLKGKKVLGDDIYLLNAIKKDTTGVTYNSINYAYDLQSRKLRSDIALLPLSLKSQQKEVLNSLDLDNAISLLEKNSVESIPVQNFGLALSNEQRDNKILRSFLKWVITSGQSYNHEAGFLNLDESTLSAQKAQTEEKLLTAIQ
ncbi:MAG: hypothetical protein Q8909_16915, partial [Bacteroidota bacterium]|nr:hypothetical protein [Bacteroidota bacterium]